jgi:hypothetical protein
VRACLDATVDAVTANGWYVTGLDEAKNAAELWLREHEDEFFLFLRNLVLTTLVFDESYIECTGGFPRVIAPWTMQVVRDEHGFVTGYVQQTRDVVRFEPEDIVHIVLHPLADRAYGSPKIATLARTPAGPSVRRSSSSTRSSCGRVFSRKPSSSSRGMNQPSTASETSWRRHGPGTTCS